jgi:hypothetical protein
LVVDASGGGQYLDLQPAIHAASDGDVILVKSGSYGVADIVAKSLVLTADLGATVDCSTVSVSQLAAHQSVSVRGLQIGSTFNVSGNAGFVLIESCTIRTLAGLALLVDQSSQTAVVDCDLVNWGLGNPRDAARVSRSVLYVYDSNFVGGDVGLLPGAHLPQTGGDGIAADDSSILFVSASTIRGGRGEDGDCLVMDGGPGGDAIQASDHTVVLLLGAVLVPGAGGIPQIIGGTDGPPGEMVRLLANSVSADVPGGPRSFSAQSPVRAGSTSALVFVGQAGDLALLALSAGFAPFPSIPFAGVVFLSAPLLGIQVHGMLPDDQPFASSLTPSPLPSGMLELQVRLQGAFLTSAGALRLGPASTLVVLDPSI